MVGQGCVRAARGARGAGKAVAIEASITSASRGIGGGTHQARVIERGVRAAALAGTAGLTVTEVACMAMNAISELARGRIEEVLRVACH